MRIKKTKVYRRTPVNVPGVFILLDNFWGAKEILEIDKHLYYFVVTKISWTKTTICIVEDLFCVGPEGQWVKEERRNVGVHWITSGLDDL